MLAERIAPLRPSHATPLADTGRDGRPFRGDPRFQRMGGMRGVLASRDDSRTMGENVLVPIDGSPMSDIEISISSPASAAMAMVCGVSLTDRRYPNRPRGRAHQRPPDRRGQPRPGRRRLPPGFRRAGLAARMSSHCAVGGVKSPCRGKHGARTGARTGEGGEMLVSRRPDPTRGTSRQARSR